MLASLVLELLTMLFWFAGFVALAVFHRDLVNDANFFFVGGCDDLGNTCGVIEAAVVFGALEWYVKLPCQQWTAPRDRGRRSWRVSNLNQILSYIRKCR